MKAVAWIIIVWTGLSFLSGEAFVGDETDIFTFIYGVLVMILAVGILVARRKNAIQVSKAEKVSSRQQTQPIQEVES